jgi:dihydroorotate dehydrogenase
MNLYQFFRPLIFLLEPESAHNLAIRLIKNYPFCSKKIACKINEYDNLAIKLWNLEFKNPIGMAAGFDKNAKIAAKLAKFGFGFVECGTVTPLAQSGNLKPRIFRLNEDQAIINRLGFNNEGADCFLDNIKTQLRDLSQLKIPIGINIGKNKDSKDAVLDYILLLDKFYDYASYITINISSPNTKNLRDIQKSDYLNFFLKAIKDRQKILQAKSKNRPPLLLKIAPDLTNQEQEEIADTCLSNKIDGLIISNTTILRLSNLSSRYKNEQGGLSGKILFNQSNQVLKNIYALTKAQIPIIGVGGISNAEDAYQKISLGASLLQIYTAFIYQGFGLVEKIKSDLSKKIAAKGFKNLSQAIGCEVKH